MPHSIALRPSIPSLLCFDHPNMVSGVVSASQGHCISFVMHLQVLDNGSTCREMLTWLSTWEAQDAISANRNPSSCYHKEVLHECDPDQECKDLLSCTTCAGKTLLQDAKHKEDVFYDAGHRLR